MTTSQQPPRVRVVCLDCHFEEVVEKAGRKPAKVIIEHGRDAGHKLTTEKVDSAR